MVDLLTTADSSESDHRPALSFTTSASLLTLAAASSGANGAAFGPQLMLSSAATPAARQALPSMLKGPGDRTPLASAGARGAARIRAVHWQPGLGR